MLNNSKSKMKILSVTLVLILMTLMAAVFLCNTPTATAEEFKPSNFVTARKTGTLNGTLQKQPDGSVTFNGEMIASAEENLSQMYVILQGAGGAGGNRGLLFSNCNGGGGGAFAVVLVKFKPNLDTNGNPYYLPVDISSGLGGKMNKYPSTKVLRDGTDSVIKIDTIGSISATTGISACSTNIIPSPGGIVASNPISDIMNEYMEITYKQDGKTSNSNNTSHIFTISMYKNGGWLSTKTFNTHLGGSNLRGGGASPYSRGGNGVYYDFALIWTYPESAPSYGAGGGGTLSLFNIPENCDESIYGTGGSGGDGFIEILG